jgi:TolA-binding protein
VFSRYLTYYPSGRNAVQAAKNLETAESFLNRIGNSRGSGPAAESYGLSGQGASSGGGGGDRSETAKAYYDAVSFISQEKYQQAYLAFKKIADAGEEPEYTAKGVYEIGRCLFLLNKYDDCIKHYTMMITKYPKHPNLGDALFFMGQSYEKNGRKDQAMVFYKKILTMVTDEDEAVHIKAKRALGALEE